MKERFGMPIEQLNAVLDDEMVMRVGVPHKGGRLAFHCFENRYPAMVSANAFWNVQQQRFAFPEATDLSELDFALDSAGYTAMQLWKAKGTQRGMAGIFPWSYEQYIEFAALSGASWWAQPDCCTEPGICSNQTEIDFRIDTTATLLEGCLRIVYEWQNELAKTCSANTVANMIKPPVPVIQGWSVSDYLRSLEMLISVWNRWTPWLAAPALIGVGSVCRRTLNHPTHGLYAVLAGLEGQLPSGARLHMFGIKGACLNELKMRDRVASCDSMAWDLGARVKAHRAGTSNSIKHRSNEMDRWMSTAAARMRPAAGDQFRLGLFA